MGALTSKVYSFSLRPWELKTVETFDFIDSWTSSIFLNFKDLKIVRILPRVTDSGVDSFWISDKTRFFFDALSCFRVKVPSIFYKGINFNVSWYKVLNYLNFIFLKVFSLNLKVSFKFLFSFFINSSRFKINFPLKFIFLRDNVFDFEDIKTNFYKNIFYNLFWFENFYNFQSYTSRKNYFITNKTFENLNYIFLININVRIEFPMLFLLLRKLVNLGFSKVFFWGEHFFSNFNFFFTFMGNNVFEFFNFLKGKNIYSYLLFSDYLLLLGESLLFRKDFRNLFFFLFYKNYNFHILSSNIGSLNFFDLGFLGSGFSFVNKLDFPKIFFSKNMEENLSRITDFSVLVSSHITKPHSKFDVVLPSNVGYEFNLLTNNLFGEKKSINRVIRSENLDLRPSWKIFEIFFYKFSNVIGYSNQLAYSSNFLEDLMKYCSFKFCYIFIENKKNFFFFNTLIENPKKKYKDLNYITQSSRILGLVDRFSNKYNFNFF